MKKMPKVYQRLLFITLFFLAACDVRHTAHVEEPKEDKHVTVPTIDYDISDVFFDRKTSLWQLNTDSTFVSGHVYERYSNGTLHKAFSVYEGKKEGSLIAYFLNGKVKYSESYSNNKLDGVVRRYAQENGHQLLAELRYKAGKLHGEQRKWFPTGELHMLMNMTMGKEDGLQKAFRKNGVLYANYEAVEGRTFGMKRSNLCYELDNEQVVYRD